jgi:hypothetical protein
VPLAQNGSLPLRQIAFIGPVFVQEACLSPESHSVLVRIQISLTTGPPPCSLCRHGDFAGQRHGLVEGVSRQKEPVGRDIEDERQCDKVVNIHVALGRLGPDKAAGDDRTSMLA